MSKFFRPAAALLTSICLAAILSAGCQEQKEKPVETVKAPEPAKPAEPGSAPVVAPAPLAPVAPVTPALPPGHPALPSKPTQPSKSAPVQDLKAIPQVALSEVEVGESEDGVVTRITVKGEGNFASNVIRKENPERIILLIHNAKAGNLVGTMEVNNGTVGRIEVAQLESGQGPAVRITVGLLGKSDYRVVPADKALALDIRLEQHGEAKQ